LLRHDRNKRLKVWGTLMRIFIVGAKAQARLSHQVLIAQGHAVPYVFDHDSTLSAPWDCLLLHEEADFDRYARKCEGFLVCLGDVERGKTRVALSERLELLGLAPCAAIHPSAFIPDTATIGKGLQTFPCSVVGDFSRLGNYCILGINCAIDHDARVGNGVHVMGGAAVAGEVAIGDYSTIGANATVLPGLKIGQNAIVGAGAVVTKDVPDNVIVAGVPAKVLRQR
jgi:sugar O-acyltransferase (sialic acid O-acetyltransferase NeuD family)